MHKLKLQSMTRLIIINRNNYLVFSFQRISAICQRLKPLVTLLKLGLAWRSIW